MLSLEWCRSWEQPVSIYVLELLCPLFDINAVIIVTGSLAQSWLIRRLLAKKPQVRGPPKPTDEPEHEDIFREIEEKLKTKNWPEIYKVYLCYETDTAAKEGRADGPPEIPLDDDCFTYKATVSYVGNEHGLLNENQFFNRIDGPADLKENEVVIVLAYCLEGKEDDFVILRVYRPEVLPVQKCKRMATVTSRVGREVLLDDGAFSLDLDSASTLFTPQVGDVLELCEVREDGRTLDRVHWSDYCCKLGWVSTWDELRREGRVDNDTYVHQDACVAGYRPRVGDQVVVDAIATSSGWRAVITVLDHTPKHANPGLGCNPEEIRLLCAPKHGITIVAETFSFGRLPYGGETAITMFLENSGGHTHTLVRSVCHTVHRFTQTRPILPHNRIISPGRSMRVDIACRGLSLGHNREIPIFEFENFSVGCVLDMEVVHPATSQMESASSSSVRAARYYHGMGIHRNQHILSGERPIQPPKFIERKLLQYNVPERFWEAFLNQNEQSKALPEIQQEVEDITPCLKEVLHFDVYTDWFHTMLYLEEVDAMLKLSRYKIERTKFTMDGSFLRLEVPGLSEKRPALLVGDVVLASCPWRQEGLVYEGFVQRTCETYVLLGFNADFHVASVGLDFRVEFKFGRTALRRQHAAIDVAKRHLGRFILFPHQMNLKEPQTTREVRWLNKNLNEQQRNTVLNVLAGVARPLPYIIFGPPGTGKTVTLVELILQTFLLIPESRILIATPSNSSANLLAERLIASGRIRPGDLVRLVGFHVYEDSNLPESLAPYCTTGNIKMMAGSEAQAQPPGALELSSNKKTLAAHRIIVGTCIALGQLFTMGLQHGSFTHVLVDEAGQATEPEIVVALDFVKTDGGQIILAGDPMQLGPVIGSNLALQYGMGQSYMERLLYMFPYECDTIGHPATHGYDPRLVSFLLKNYRTLPEILELPNKLFYESKLIPQVSAIEGPAIRLLRSFANWLPKRNNFNPTPSIMWHGVRGTDLQESESPSWFNPQEAVVVLNYLTKLVLSGVSPDDIGVITPYRKQVQKMRWFYGEHLHEVPKIGSVEEFQGQERKVIILSVVRSSSNQKVLDSDAIHSLGFLASSQRLNVSLTRAQVLLIIVGNPHVLSKDDSWRATLEYCIRISAYIGCDVPLESMRSIARLLE